MRWGLSGLGSGLMLVCKHQDVLSVLLQTGPCELLHCKKYKKQTETLFCFLADRSVTTVSGPAVDVSGVQAFVLDPCTP